MIILTIVSLNIMKVDYHFLCVAWYKKFFFT